MPFSCLSFPNSAGDLGSYRPQLSQGGGRGAKPWPQTHFDAVWAFKNVSRSCILSRLYPTKMAVTKKITRFVAMGLFHEWAGCCSILSTRLNPVWGVRYGVQL